MRAWIQNDDDRVLLILRRDNGQWALPAGGAEIDETVFEAMVREVKEETGLDVHSATPVAFHSGPGFRYVAASGQASQLFCLLFRVDEWSGEVLKSTDETTGAEWYPLDAFNDMDLSPVTTQSIQDIRAFDGTLICR